MAHANMLSGKSFMGGRPLPCISHSAVCQSRMAPKRLEVTARAELPSIGMVGTKAGMTQIFKDGLAIPASVIALDEGNIVTQVIKCSINLSLIVHHGNVGKPSSGCDGS